MQESLALTSSFPKELSMTGHLQMTRREALKMTGRLFTLRMDVNLIGGILGEYSFWNRTKELMHRYTRAVLVGGFFVPLVRGYSRISRDRAASTGTQR